MGIDLCWKPRKCVIRFIGILALLFLAGGRVPTVPANAAALSQSVACSTVKIPILAYHNVDLSAPDGYYVTPENFTAQLDALIAYGYQTISLQDLVDCWGGTGSLPAKPVIITFDDGYQGVYLNAYPALKARGMTATFFIITDFVAETEAGRPDHSWLGQPLMIWPEIAQMHADGFEIGSHTKSHPINLITMYASDPAQGEEELKGSKQAIDDHLGAGKTRFLAYPHGIGADDATINQLVQDAGYHAAVAFRPTDGPADPLTDNIWGLPRPEVQPGHSLVLNPSNPWYFFMRRLDPAFPLPNISAKSFQAKDAFGRARTQFYPGEALTLAYEVYNWEISTLADGTIGRLALQNGTATAYDSHLAANDVAIVPFSGSGAVSAFQYAWNIPMGPEAPGSYTYKPAITDPTGLLGYYQPAPAAAFEVIVKPIGVTMAPARLPVLGEALTLTFTVRMDDSQAASDTYLDVSFSQHLDVIAADAQQGAWTRENIGSKIKQRDCSSPCVFYSTDLLYEMYDPSYGMGERTYQLTVMGLPGINSQDWIKFRLAMKMGPDYPNPGETYLRDPLQGEFDQQDYFAWKVPGVSQVFLPIVMH
jgi:peptidoglycan/xylan/chitin deacetylase (PgdA/CDA1 family)